MSLIPALPTVIASAALLLIPGLVVGLLIRLRGLWLWALSPAVSTTLLTAGSVVLPWLGIAWHPLSALLFAAAFGAVVVVLFRFVLRARFAPAAGDDAEHRPWPAVVAWAAAAVLIGSYTIAGVGSADDISQTFDNVFHLNAIALIGDTGNASPFEIARLTSPDGGQEFYPDGWHALVQLAQQLSGATVPVAINACNFAIAIIVWPLGSLLLARQAAGASRSAMLAAGVLAAALPAFPLLMLYYGVLYPFFFGLALAPATLAVVLNLLGLSREPRITGIAPLIVLLLGIIPAIALAHPGAMMAVLALSVPAAAVACFAGWTAASGRARVLRLGGLAVYGAVGLVLLAKLRPGDLWGPRMSFAEAAKQTVLLDLWGYGLPLITAALVVLGIVVALRRRDRVGLVSVGIWAVGAAMFLVAAGLSLPLARIPTGVWYGDAPRLAAIFAIALLPVAAIGAAWLLDAAAKRSPKPLLVQLPILLSLLLVTQLTAGYPELVKSMRVSYTADADAALLTPDEIALLERLPDEVGDDEMIAASPWTGASLAFAFADRQVVFPHILMNDVSEDRATIMDSLRDAAEDPEVCEAADRLGVRWVLDFGDREVHGDHHAYPGIDDPADSDAFELVDSEGDAKLYRLTACG